MKKRLLVLSILIPLLSIVSVFAGLAGGGIFNEVKNYDSNAAGTGTLTINFYTNGEPNGIGGSLSIYYNGYNSGTNVNISDLSGDSSARTVIGGTEQSSYVFNYTTNISPGASASSLRIAFYISIESAYLYNYINYIGDAVDVYGSGEFLSLTGVGSNIELNYYFEDDNVWIKHIGDADFSVGDGTSSLPYEISSPEQLALLAQNTNSGTSYANKYFKQTIDLDMAKYRWTPIGTESNPFAGNFDGNGYEISGLYVNTGYYAGLFGKVYDNMGNLIFKNIIVADSYISGEANVGAVAGYCAWRGTKLENCHNKNTTIVASGDSAGGLVGYISDTFGTNNSIINCTNSGDVFGKNYIGGIVGYATTENHGSTITNCINNGSVISTGERTGGIVGSASKCEVSKCIVNGKVISQSRFVGGFVGQFTGNSNIKNCYFTGALISKNSTSTNSSKSSGWFVGGDGYSYSSVKITMLNCSFIGSSSAEVTGYARLYNPNVSSCYAFTNGAGYYSSGDFAEFAFVENMNNNLPIQRELFSVAVDSSSGVLNFFSNNPNFQLQN